MGHTNETTNLELSQFLGTDKPAWLVDYNGDMAKIDAYVYAIKVKADANENAITSLGNRVTAIENNLTNTIIPALTAAQNNITILQGNITTINSLIGNGTPTTTDQTLIGAINEMNANFIAPTTVALTPASSNVTILDNTSHKVGKLIVINARIKLDATLSAGNSLLVDLPKADTSLTPGSAFAYVGSSNGDFGFANTAGDKCQIMAMESINTSASFVISGSYFAE